MMESAIDRYAQTIPDLEWNQQYYTGTCPSCGGPDFRIKVYGPYECEPYCPKCKRSKIEKAVDDKLPEESVKNSHAEEPAAPTARGNGKAVKEPYYRKIEIYTLDGLRDKELAESKVIVRDLIHEGFNLYAGKFKSGKSFFVLNVAVAIANGTTALGEIPVEGGEVLYLALEDTERRLKKRAHQMLGGNPWPRRLHIAHYWPNVGDGALSNLRQWLDAHPQARLVIVDTLKKIRATSRNGGGYDDDYDFVGELKAIADEYAIGLLGLHHTRKATAEDIFDMINATTGFGGAADTIVVWERKRGTPYVRLHITGRDVEEERTDEDAYVLEWDKDIGGWAFSGIAKEVLVSDERREIQDCLASAGKPLTPGQIATALGKNASTTGVLLRKMIEDEEIGQVGYGKYVYPINSVKSVNSVPDPRIET